MPTSTEESIKAKQAEFKEELLNNEALWKHYSEYSEASIENLIEVYALYKARLTIHGNYTRYHHEYVLEEWTDRCWFALGEIQSKKLFDLQCRWRAGEIDDLPGIKWTHDFGGLGIPVLDYEAIPPVTEADIDHYISYLKTPAGQIQIYYGLNSHQNYDQIRRAHVNGNGYMPEYYNYHYQTYGNTHLLTLPDIREEEEDRLIDLAIDLNKKRIAAKKEKPQPAIKPSVPYHREEAKIALAEFLGEKQMVTFLRDLEKWVNEKPSFETDWAMDYLSRCYPDSVPMPAAPCWQEAIQRAALDHISLKVQEKLPGTYEEYLMKKQLGTRVGEVKGENTKGDKAILRLLEVGERLDRGEAVDPDEVWKH